MNLAPDFRDLLEELGRGGVEFVLVGGYAVAFHGRPRSTKDIDILLLGTADNLDRAASAVERFGGPPNVVAALRSMTDSEVVFMGQPPMRVDFLRLVDGVTTTDIFAGAVSANIDGVGFKVISREHLVANKRAAGRPQDLLDADFLERQRG